MKHPNELINPEAIFISIEEVGKLFSPPVSRQKLSELKKSGALPLESIKISYRFFYYKPHVIALILKLCEKDMNYDLDATL